VCSSDLISGHPLDDFKFEMKYFCNVGLEELDDLRPLVGKTLMFGGMISDVQFRTSAKGKDWAMFTVEGYDESKEFRIFNEDFLKIQAFFTCQYICLFQGTNTRRF